MRNASINHIAMSTIAKTRAERNDDVVYVGGAAISLYVTDPAANPRPTPIM